MNIDHENIKRKIRLSPFTMEQVVVAVQEKGLNFSIAQLGRLLRGDYPKNNLQEILEIIATKIKCNVADFFFSDEAA